MAEQIRERRLKTEMENVNKIDQTKIQIDEKEGFLGNGKILTLTFNLKDHPFNPKLLKLKDESSLYSHDYDGEGEGNQENTEEDQVDEDAKEEPIDNQEDREYQFDLLIPKKFPFVFPELRARCDFTEPSIMDERDLMEDLLGKQWHPFIILKDIIEMVPQYIYRLKRK